MKKQIQCPFEIKFGFINKLKRSIKTDIMHRVIITEVNNEHHCELSKEFYNVAARSTRRIPKYDLKKMEGIMGLLKNNPNLSPLSLRPLLSECVPTYFIVDL